MLKKLILLLLVFTALTCSKEDEDTSTANTITIEEPAVVQVITYILTVTAGEGGSVTTGGTYDEGTDVTLTATPYRIHTMTMRNWLTTPLLCSNKVEQTFFVTERDKGDYNNLHAHMLIGTNIDMSYQEVRNRL